MESDLKGKRTSEFRARLNKPEPSILGVLKSAFIRGKVKKALAARQGQSRVKSRIQVLTPEGRRAVKMRV